MRVLLVCGTYPPMRCGVGDYTAGLAHAFGRRGDVTVAVLTGSGAARTKEERVELFPEVRTWKIADAPSILRRIRHWRPDIVHVQYPTLYYGEIQWVLPTIARSGKRSRSPDLARILLFTKLAQRAERGDDGWPGRCSSPLQGENAAMVSLVDPAQGVPLHPERIVDSADPADRGRAGRRPIRGWSTRRRPDRLFRVRIALQGDRIALRDRGPATSPARPYLRPVRRRHLPDVDPRPRESGDWAGKVTVTGFSPRSEAGRLLAAADAAVFPFLGGGGEWNSSIHGAAAQGTFVLATSLDRRGYDDVKNIYYAVPGDVGEMRQALREHLGRRRAPSADSPEAEWDSIAEAHLELYRTLLGRTGEASSSVHGGGEDH